MPRIPAVASSSLALLALLLIGGPARAQLSQHALPGHAQVSPPHDARTTQERVTELALSGDCDPSWLPTFGGMPGVDGLIRDLLVHDDGAGGGPALYIAGDFESAGGVAGTAGIARWDGASWSSVGGGTDGSVSTLCVFDDGLGGGPVLAAGGSFGSAGGGPGSRVATWDGSAWSALGAQVTGGVNALAAYDAGGGSKLYAAGLALFGGVPVKALVIEWDGAAWSVVGEFTSSSTVTLHALAVYDDGLGGGPALYAGGRYTAVYGAPANRIAKWSGGSWSVVGGGVAGLSAAEVRCLSVLDVGTGPLLYVGGMFTTAGAGSASRIVAWDGLGWRVLGSGVANFGSSQPWVAEIGVFDGGSGPRIYAGGHFGMADGQPANNIASWDGGSWSALDDGVTGAAIPDVAALAVFDDGEGPRLQVAGDFGTAGDVEGGNLAAWDGDDWFGVAVSPDSGLDSRVRAVLAFDDGRGGGPAVFVGGDFVSAGGQVMRHIARWDGSSWSPLGEGLDGSVLDLTVFDDGLGGGPVLYACGAFHASGGEPMRGVARWNGATWSALGGDFNHIVWDLQVYDDGLGAGPLLFAGGDFTDVEGTWDTEYIAKWDGRDWSSVSGVGMSGGDIMDGQLTTWVDCLEVFDDGSGGGPALFVGGLFNVAGGVPARRIAKWDGLTWSALGAGTPGSNWWVDDLEVFDDGAGDGPGLYVAGVFDDIAGVPADGIARWSGTSWSALGSGVSGSSQSMAVLDDGSGSGPDLIVGGITLAGGVPVDSVARWDGASWSALGAGTGGTVLVVATVPQGGGGGFDLLVGGDFVSAAGSGDSFLALWSGCPVEPSPWTFLGYALPGLAGPPLLAGTGTLAAGSSGTLALTHARPSALSVLFVSLAGLSAPFKCGTLVPVPVSMQIPLFTNGSGNLPLGWAAWPGGLSGVGLSFQYAIQDPAAVCGVALSNALRADIP